MTIWEWSADSFNFGRCLSVHRSPSHSSVRPFVIVLQSNDFGRLPTRIVAPLLLVRDQAYVFNAFDLATIGVQRLGELVASFAEDDDAKRRIQVALDFVLKPF